jgi:hypothetical protein
VRGEFLIMIVGAAVSAGGLCHSSGDIWASDDFAKAVLVPAFKGQ